MAELPLSIKTVANLHATESARLNEPVTIENDARTRLTQLYDNQDQIQVPDELE